MTTNTVPRTIGVILDGNRRWAKERGLPTLEGHRQGSKKVEELLVWAKDMGIEHVVLYAFSTENWNRSPEEVTYLMQLFEETLNTLGEQVEKQGGRIICIGERERFPRALQERMHDIEERTKEGTEGTAWVALSYGGRAEILHAVNALLEKGVKSVTEDSFKNEMWSKGLPDPDLIIRTGGEKRLSNFLTWQAVYSELYFTETKLPDLSKEEFVEILRDYSERERRHGK